MGPEALIDGDDRDALAGPCLDSYQRYARIERREGLRGELLGDDYEHALDTAERQALHRVPQRALIE